MSLTQLNKNETDRRWMACTFCWSRVLTYFWRYIRRFLSSGKFINETDAKPHHSFSWNTTVIHLWPIYVVSVICVLLFPWFSIWTRKKNGTQNTWNHIHLSTMTDFSSKDIFVYFSEITYIHTKTYAYMITLNWSQFVWEGGRGGALDESLLRQKPKNFPCLMYAIWNDDIQHWDSICRAAMTKEDEWWKLKQEEKENNDNGKVETNGIMFTGQT